AKLPNELTRMVPSTTLPVFVTKPGMSPASCLTRNVPAKPFSVAPMDALFSEALSDPWKPVPKVSWWKNWLRRSISLVPTRKNGEELVKACHSSLYPPSPPPVIISRPIVIMGRRGRIIGIGVGGHDRWQTRLIHIEINPLRNSILGTEPAARV